MYCARCGATSSWCRPDGASLSRFGARPEPGVLGPSMGTHILWQRELRVPRPVSRQPRAGLTARGLCAIADLLPASTHRCAPDQAAWAAHQLVAQCDRIVGSGSRAPNTKVIMAVKT